MLKHSWRKWRGCSIVKSICCSCKWPRLISQYHIVVQNHLSSSRGSCAAWWPQLTAGIRVMNRHTRVSLHHSSPFHLFFHISICFSLTFLLSCFFYLINLPFPCWPQLILKCRAPYICFDSFCFVDSNSTMFVGFCPFKVSIYTLCGLMLQLIDQIAFSESCEDWGDKRRLVSNKTENDTQANKYANCSIETQET